MVGRRVDSDGRPVVATGRLSLYVMILLMRRRGLRLLIGCIFCSVWVLLGKTLQKMPIRVAVAALRCRLAKLPSSDRKSLYPDCLGNIGL